MENETEEIVSELEKTQEEIALEERALSISNARALLDFIEAHPKLAFSGLSLFTYQFTSATKEEIAEFVRTLGHVDKEYIWENLYIKKRFGDSYYSIVVPRSRVCERVVISTKVIPAQPERTVVLPATEAKVEEEVDWKCIPLLAESEPSNEDAPSTQVENPTL